MIPLHSFESTSSRPLYCAIYNNMRTSRRLVLDTFRLVSIVVRVGPQKKKTRQTLKQKRNRKLKAETFEIVMWIETNKKKNQKNNRTFFFFFFFFFGYFKTERNVTR